MKKYKIKKKIFYGVYLRQYIRTVESAGGNARRNIDIIIILFGGVYANGTRSTVYNQVFGFSTICEYRGVSAAQLYRLRNGH